MPLPGGASDKAGNQYEYLWTLVSLVDVVLGSATSIRLEPPGTDGIEFSVDRMGHGEVHQVKRGLGAEGRWTVSALGAVLDAFKTHLSADVTRTCVFASGHAAFELDELSDRARRAQDYAEFDQAFLVTSQSLRSAFERVCSGWNVDAPRGWDLLKRVRCETASQGQLEERLDQLLDTLYDSARGVARAVLTKLVMESTHLTLTAKQVTAYLANHNIRRRESAVPPPPDTLTPPPPLEYFIGRAEVLKACLADLGRERSVVMGGPSGIGKSSVAAGICHNWNTGPVLWVDCGAYSGFRPGAAAVSQMASSLGCPFDASFQNPSAPPRQVGRIVAAFLNRVGGLVVWDGCRAVGEDAEFIGGVAASLKAGAQIVTTTNYGALLSVAGLSVHDVPPLSRADVVEIILKLAGRRPSEQLVSATHGLPYLAQLAANLVRRLADDDATATLADRGDEWIATTVVDQCSGLQLRLLETASVFKAAFKAAWVVVTHEEQRAFTSMVAMGLVVRFGRESYAVHDVIRDLVWRRIAPERRTELHALAAVKILPAAQTTIGTLREYSHHARHAGMHSEAAKATVALVATAAENGEWSLVTSSTGELTEADRGPDWATAWYFRGRALRMLGALEDAQVCYERAQVSADTRLATVSKFERASVLALLGDTDAAKRVYRELASSSDPAFASQAHSALGLLLSREGPFSKATPLFSQACAIARKAKLTHELSQAEQSWGIAVMQQGRPKEAIKHLRASYELRMTVSTESWSTDIIGWQALYEALVDTETELGNRKGARNAAFGLWQFAAISGNLRWLAEATYALSNAGEKDDENARVARRDLHMRLRTATADAPIRAIVGFLAASYWCAGEVEESLACNLEFDREGEADKQEGIPIIFYKPPPTDKRHGWARAWPFPGGWFYLLGPEHDDDAMTAAFEVARRRFPGSTRTLAMYQKPEGSDRGRPNRRKAR